MTLTDILGAEDAFGDMDFKVAGTAGRGDRAAARHQDRRPARRGPRPGAAPGQGGAAQDPRRAHRDDPRAPRAEVAEGAPKIVSFEIPIDKIGEVIGPEGQGHQHPAAGDRRGHRRRRRRRRGHGHDRGQGRHARSTEARRRIEMILDPPTADVGAIYTGRVVNLTKFGAFVNILPGPRRPAAHLEALLAHGRQAGRPGRGRPRARPGRRGPRRRHRPGRARSRCRSRATSPRSRASARLARAASATAGPARAAATATAGRARAVTARPATTARLATTARRARARRESRRSRTPSRPSWPRSWATSGRAGRC